MKDSQFNEKTKSRLDSGDIIDHFNSPIVGSQTSGPGDIESNS